MTLARRPDRAPDRARVPAPVRVPAVVHAAPPPRVIPANDIVAAQIARPMAASTRPRAGRNPTPLEISAALVAEAQASLFPPQELLEHPPVDDPLGHPAAALFAPAPAAAATASRYAAQTSSAPSVPTPVPGTPPTSGAAGALAYGEPTETMKRESTELRGRVEAVARVLQSHWVHPPSSLTKQVDTLMLHRVRAIIALDPDMTQDKVCELSGVTPNGLKWYLKGFLRAGRLQTIVETKLSSWIAQYYDPFAVAGRKTQRMENWQIQADESTRFPLSSPRYIPKPPPKPPTPCKSSRHFLSPFHDVYQEPASGQQQRVATAVAPPASGAGNRRLQDANSPIPVAPSLILPRSSLASAAGPSRAGPSAAGPSAAGPSSKPLTAKGRLLHSDIAWHAARGTLWVDTDGISYSKKVVYKDGVHKGAAKKKKHRRSAPALHKPDVDKPPPAVTIRKPNSRYSLRRTVSSLPQKSLRVPGAVKTELDNAVLRHAKEINGTVPTTDAAAGAPLAPAEASDRPGSTPAKAAAPLSDIMQVDFPAGAPSGANAGVNGTDANVPFLSTLETPPATSVDADMASSGLINDAVLKRRLDELYRERMLEDEPTSPAKRARLE